MSEVKITPIIPYSIAHSMFVMEINNAFRLQSDKHIKCLVEALKENWVLFNSFSKDIFIDKFSSHKKVLDICDLVELSKIVTEFIDWAEQNRDRQQSTAQPLNAVIEFPVVNLNKGKKD